MMKIFEDGIKSSDKTVKWLDDIESSWLGEFTYISYTFMAGGLSYPSSLTCPFSDHLSLKGCSIDYITIF